MAPTAAQINKIFQLRESQHEEFLAYLDDDITLTTTGHNHHLAGEIKGKENLKTQHMAPILAMLDKKKAPVQQEVVRVVGGGDSAWAAVELKTTSHTKAGKPYIHENVYIVHFNGSDKIDIMRAYYDTAHVHGHLSEHKK